MGGYPFWGGLFGNLRDTIHFGGSLRDKCWDPFLGSQDDSQDFSCTLKHVRKNVVATCTSSREQGVASSKQANGKCRLAPRTLAGTSFTEIPLPSDRVHNG